MELNHSVGVTSAIQTQLNAKVAAASPTITGTATIAKVVIAGTGGGTIDNTVIGATTPLAGTFTTGTFTTLTVGPVDNTEMGYLDGATSNLQTQMDLKAPKASPSFTGNATFAAEVTATQYNSSGADGTHYVNVLNQATPSDVTRGNCFLDNTTLVWKCSDGATYSGYSGTVTPSTTDTFTNKTYDAGGTGNVFTLNDGTNPTVSSAGQVGIDTTAGQLVYYDGTVARALSGVKHTMYNNFGPGTGNIVILMFTERPITITKIVVVNELAGTPSVPFQVYHATTHLADSNTVFSGTQTSTSKTTGDVYTSFSDATVPTNSWIYYRLSGTVTSDMFHMSVFYTEDRQ